MVINPHSVCVWCARISLVRLADCKVSAMVIACSPCNGGPLRAGNQAWEADRQSEITLVAKGLGTLDCERMSPSESEPDSASLHTVGAANLPDWVKPDTCREGTGTCTCRAPRGDWGGRVGKDASRNLGDPLRLGVGAGGGPGINNRKICRERESERPIVAKKSWRQDGAKGPCCGQAESERRCAAWTEVPLRSSWRCGDL